MLMKNSVANLIKVRNLWILTLPLLASCALWLPALNVPFWQDDYFYILNAHTSDVAGEPFLASLWPNDGYKSWNWRPLSQDLYWRLVEGELLANPWLAHFLNIGMLYAAAFSFGLFAYFYSKLNRWDNPVLVAILAGGLYAVSDFNFLPVYWASAANSSILSIFVFMTLAMLLLFEELEDVTLRFFLGLLVISLSMMSLLIKESAILLPCLWILVKLSIGQRWKHLGEQLFLLLLFVIGTVLWWEVRASFVLPTPPEYGLQISFNVVRNFFAQIAWVLNIPRESIRLLTIGQFEVGLIWIGLSLVPVVLAIFYVKTPLSNYVTRRQFLLALLFTVVAYAPYYFLGWNSYEYYVSISVGLLLLLFSKGILVSSQPLIPVALVLISSFSGVIGNSLVGYPSLMARALWAESTLVALEKMRLEPPLLVRVSDQHRFSAIGAEGLAWRLKIPREQIIFTDQCSIEAPQMLIEDGRGRILVEDCQRASKAIVIDP